MTQGTDSQTSVGGDRGNPVPSPTPAPGPDPVTAASDLLAQILGVLTAILAGATSGGTKKLLKVRAKAVRLIPEFLQLAVSQSVYAPKGSDPAALLQEWDLVSRLVAFLSTVSGLHKELSAVVLTKEAEIWKTVLAIYNLAAAHANAGGDKSVADLVSRMKAALANGPKAQKSVKTPIKPTPVKGAKAKKALLAAPVLEAALATAAEAKPAAEPAPLPVAPGNGSGGGAGGSGH